MYENKYKNKYRIRNKSYCVFLWMLLMTNFTIWNASASPNEQAGVESVSAGVGYTCATLKNGSAWCWGRDNKHQLRSDSAANKDNNLPSRVSGEGLWETVDSSFRSSCGIKVDGTWWCWGAVTRKLSPGVRKQSFLALIKQLQDEVYRDWYKVATSDLHACAIKRDGTLWCFGANESHQIGKPDQLYMHIEDKVLPVGRLMPFITAFVPNPLQVGKRAEWKSVAVGNDHTCAIDKTDRLWCWGGNDQGQLGLPSNAKYGAPTLVDKKATWQQVTIGAKFTCAIKSDKSLWCWGNNEGGQLGGGIEEKVSHKPVRVKLDKQWLFVDAKLGATCAIAQDHSLWCWGTHLLFPTADNSNRVNAPIQTAMKHQWNKVAVGGEHLCAVKTDGTLWCWGFGGLGLGRDVDRTLQPLQVLFPNVD